MKLLRFTDAGVAKTRAFLAAVKESNDVENVTLDGEPFTRATLLSSPAYSDAIPALADIDLDETRTFDTTFAFCEYFDSLIHDHNPQVYREDVGFWTWLAFVYLPQLVKTSNAKIVLGDESRLIFNPLTFGKSHRHLLASSFYFYCLHADKSLVELPLTHSINTSGDILEAMIARQEISGNAAYLKTARTLYFNEAEGCAKPRVGGPNAPGGIRRLIDMIDQFGRTRDFYDECDAKAFIEILPKEFLKFVK